MFSRVEYVSPIQKIVFYLVLGVLALVFIYPFIFMVATSLKDSPEVFQNILALFGKNLRFENYKIVLGTVNVSQYLLNTAFVTVCVCIGQIITSLLGGYAFALIHFPGRDLIFSLYLGTIMIPFTVIMIPMYKMMVV